MFAARKKVGRGAMFLGLKNIKDGFFYCQKLLKKLKRRIDITINDLI